MQPFQWRLPHISINVPFNVVPANCNCQLMWKSCEGQRPGSHTVQSSEPLGSSAPSVFPRRANWIQSSYWRPSIASRNGTRPPYCTVAQFPVQLSRKRPKVTRSHVTFQYYPAIYANWLLFNAISLGKLGASFSFYCKPSGEVRNVRSYTSTTPIRFKDMVLSSAYPQLHLLP
jgi:hypothetical protein